MKFLTNIDLGKNELQNARVQNLGTAPTNPVPGQIYFNTTDKTYYGWDGSNWIDLGVIFSNKGILDSITAAFTTALKSKLDGISTGANKTENSAANGNIKIDGVEQQVYVHPAGTNPHNTTKSDVGLGNVENKSSATIRSEITSKNVTDGLGFTPVKNGGSTPELRAGNETARPTATGSGMVYFATDTKKIWKDTATETWTQMGGQDSIDWSAITNKPGTFTPPIASQTSLGGIKVGANLSITEDGVLNANDNPATFIRKQERFVVGVGQTVFNLTKGTYKPNTGAITWFLNGDKQDDRALTETSSTSVALPTGLPEGGEILFEYFEVISMSPFPYHASEHLSDGADPIPLVTSTADGLARKEDKSKLDGIEAGANKYVHPSSHPASMITGLATVATSGSYNDLSNKPSLGTAASKNTGTANGNVPIIGSDGKLDASIMPAIAVTDTFVVNSQTAMLALIAQTGDVCVRTDLNKSFILKAVPASTLVNWQELLTPTDVVTSVAGKTGAVTLTKNDVGLSNVDNVQQAPKADFDNHNGDNTRHITSGERTAWNNKTDKYAVNIGNGTATSFTVTHNLGSQDITVTLRENASPYNVVFTDIQITDANNIKLLFAQAPSLNQYKVVIVG
nr:hypothetical protein [Fredinandcohnia onubensis]